MTPPLRAWQQSALTKFLATEGNFMLAACPGSGKTRFALTVAKREMDQGRARRVVIVVPWEVLCDQMIREAAKVGLKLVSADHGKRFAQEPPGYHGVVTTYASVASQPLLYRRNAANSLVVLDEVHHAGDATTWGASLLQAFPDVVARRLLMTGTPWRRDNVPIPFSDYDDDRLHVDYAYTFKDAWSETPSSSRPIRDINFHRIDTHCRWIDGKGSHNLRLSAASPDEEPAALSNALTHDGDWWAAAWQRADAVLTSKRLTVPDAGGLVIADDQARARQYADYIKRRTGREPALVISDNDDASRHLSDFAGGASPWCVTVRKVSEGVDIPRLEVLMYATNILTPLFFHQAVGRVIRRRGQADDNKADIFLPASPSLERMCADIEEMLRHAIEQREERDSREGVAPSTSTRVNLGNLHAEYLGVIQQDGVDVSGDILDLVSNSLPAPVASYAPQIAVAIKRSGLLLAPQPVKSDPLPPTREERERQANRLASRRDALLGFEPGTTNKQACKRYGRRAELPDSDLEHQIAWLQEQIERHLQ